MLHNLIRLARHDVRVHVRRRVVHIPVRQTALRPVATVATEQGKDAHRFPCHVKVIFFVMSEILSQFFLFVSDVPPVPPRCLRSSNRRFTRKARHDARVHARRRVVHMPVRQTALRPGATGATEQGNCNDRIVEP